MKHKITGFFKAEYNRLVGYVRRSLSDAADRDAEDIVQDVMVSLFEKGDILESIGNLSAYIYRSLRNRIIDRYRKIGPAQSMEDVVDTITGRTMSDLIADLRYDTLDEVVRKQIRDRVYEAVDLLPDDQEAVWVATEIDGYTFDELSDLWQAPIGTLLSRKHRAVLFLREELEDLKELVVVKK